MVQVDVGYGVYEVCLTRIRKLLSERVRGADYGVHSQQVVEQGILYMNTETVYEVRGCRYGSENGSHEQFLLLTCRKAVETVPVADRVHVTGRVACVVGLGANCWLSWLLGMMEPELEFCQLATDSK